MIWWLNGNGPGVSQGSKLGPFLFLMNIDYRAGGLPSKAKPYKYFSIIINGLTSGK